ncbi:sulfotransferase family protein [Lentisalinibacter salinarum]|uniref:sulfotransferase family protein n=1 Tax=Lentisalinibacter salinarum TaxID=2992239 RepID=UPI00386406C2
MSFPPNLFLVGAQKAGTTFLASLLGQHPEICLSEPKEPGYFTHNSGKDLAWYRSRFRRPEKPYLLDATPSYSASPLPRLDDSAQKSPLWGVPTRIKDLSPDARIVYVVRDPVMRTWSSYWHAVRAGHESRSFHDAISEGSIYMRASRYFDQIQLFRECFARERISILKFESLIKDPNVTLTELLSKLDLPPLANPDFDRGQNRSFRYRGALAVVNRYLSGIGGMNRVSKAISPVLPRSLKDWAYRRLADRIPDMPEEDRRLLTQYFADQNRRLSQEYEIDLIEWSNP